jgi:DNA-binding Lrp family transcriptional regulator
MEKKLAKESCKVAKESCKVRGLSSKILKIIINIPHGISIKNISSSLAISERTIYWNIKKLEELGLIKKVDILCFASSLATSDKVAKLFDKNKIELHKLSFILDLIKKPSWWESRTPKLMKIKEYHFKPQEHLKNSKYEQGTSNNFLIQTFNNSIIFHSQKRYYGLDAYDCFIQGLNDLIKEISYFEKRLKVTLFYDNIPHLRIRSNHYNKIKDVLAERCKKEGKKFDVWINNKRRAWVDMSEPLGFETNSLEDMGNYESHISDILEKSPPKISEIANILMFVLESQKQVNIEICNLTAQNKEIAVGLKALTQVLISKNESFKDDEIAPNEPPDYIQ